MYPKPSREFLTCLLRNLTVYYRFLKTSFLSTLFLKFHVSRSLRLTKVHLHSSYITSQKREINLIIIVRSILIVLCNIHQYINSSLLPSDFFLKLLHELTISSMHGTNTLWFHYFKILAKAQFMKIPENKFSSPFSSVQMNFGELYDS